jgi:uncharacterized membrane protein
VSRATFSRRERGASAIEFALGGPLLTLTQKNNAIAGVTNLLQPVLTLLDDPLLDLFNVLGLTLGGADITILSLTADQPALAR